jgi:hypothetical protein
MYKHTLVLLLLVLIMHPMVTRAQDTRTTSSDTAALGVYLRCANSCDLDYFRDHLSWVDHLRDPADAGVYILITSMNTGSGGEEYTLFFTGQHRFTGMNDTLRFSGRADQTDDEIRQELLQRISLGLMRYLAHTEKLSDVMISERADSVKQQASVREDKWKSWLFELGSQAYFTGEKAYGNTSVSASFNVSRVTPDWKLRFKLYASYGEQRFEVDGSRYKAYRSSYSFYHLLVKSFGEHWSVGGSINAAHSTYSNLNLGGWLTPAMEYNVFPYSQSTRRSLTFFYKIGPEYNIYNDTTIYNKLSELLFFHRLSVCYSVIQNWGSISCSLYASNYLHDISKYNVSFYSDLSIRIVKGLSFDLYLNYSLIHDQLNLPRAGASPEEILLQQRELSTQYSYYISTGLSYTFGSIYNNVVNPRFGD